MDAKDEAFDLAEGIVDAVLHHRMDRRDLIRAAADEIRAYAQKVIDGNQTRNSDS